MAGCAETTRQEPRTPIKKNESVSHADSVGNFRSRVNSAPVAHRWRGANGETEFSYQRHAGEGTGPRPPSRAIIGVGFLFGTASEW